LEVRPLSQLPDSADLDTAFRRGRITRAQFIGGLAALGFTASAMDLIAGCGTAHVADPATSGLSLCLITIDGFRPDYLDLAAMPALRSLMEGGTSFSRAWVGQLQSETPVSHATLSTGAFPSHNGIIGFEWRDPVSRRELLDGWEQGSLLGQVGRDMHYVGHASLPGAIKEANPEAVVVAVSSEKVYAADAMGAHVADYILFHRFSKHYLLPSALRGQAPARSFLQNPSLALALPLRTLHDWDDLSRRLALAAFAAFAPRALMVNLPGTDVYGHAYGGPASPQVMATVAAGQDRAIGALVRAYRDAGRLDRTLFVIAGDHGMIPNHRYVGPDAVRAAVERGGARYLFHTGGTAKYIYLQDRYRNRAGAVAREMLRLDGVAAAYYRVSGGYEPVNNPIDRQLDEAYLYLTHTFQGPSAPDVVAAYRENTIGTVIPSAYGNHGGLSWGVQHVPLIFSGPGVRTGHTSGAPARMVDVAPTIARLLDLNLPHSDGVVLADAVRHSTAAEVLAQDRAHASLARLQDALRGQTETDLDDDRRNGITAPPRKLIIP
jgi:predicted AlkP superfamily pyrophosphatase or phosphodiesterase